MWCRFSPETATQWAALWQTVEGNNDNQGSKINRGQSEAGDGSTCDRHELFHAEVMVTSSAVRLI